MDDLQVGAVLRAIRRRRGLRQIDLAAVSGVSQGVVSLLERGRLDSVSVRQIRRVAGALEVAIPFALRWRGGELPRLIDEGHAALVEDIVSTLRPRAWEIIVEYSFSHFGERGSVDIVGWRSDRHALLLVEVKTRLVDNQALVASLDRKLRLVPRLLEAERGWRARQVGRIVYVAGTRANRGVVERLPETYGVAFPHRARSARTWVRDPDGPLSAIWFVASSSVASGMRERATPSRIRRPASASAVVGTAPRSRLATGHNEIGASIEAAGSSTGIPLA